MAGRGAEPPLVVVTGAAHAAVPLVASAIAATRSGATIPGGARLGLASALDAAAHAYARALSGIGQGGTDLDPTWSGAAAVLGDLVGEARRTGAVIEAADHLPDAPCLRAVPTLIERVPGLVVVNVSCDGVDFVANRRRAMPEAEFIGHCLLWAEADAAWRWMEPKLGRAVSVARESLAGDPAAVAADLGAPLGWPDDAKARFVAVVKAGPSGRTSLNGQPIDFKSVAWTLAEKTVFAELCGAGMRAQGRPLDLEGALRRRPLRLDDMVANGDAVPGGDAGNFSIDGRRGRLDVLWRDGGAGVLVVPAVALAGRRKLRVTAGPPDHGAGAASIRIDVVDSISRRSRARVERAIDDERVPITAEVEPTRELVDVIFSTSAEAPGTAFGFRLFEASVSA